jgi:hypothetical protein
MHSPARNASTVVVALGLGAGLGACDQAPTYVDVKPVLDAKCARCHQEGSNAPFTLTSADDAVRFADIIGFSVETGLMPPWVADNNCRDYHENFALTNDEKALILAWVAGGAARGDDAAAAAVNSAPPPVPALPRIDAVYQPDADYRPTVADEYRCYALPWQGPERFVTGYEFVPLTSAVHHVNLFVNPPENADFYLDNEAEDPEPGYPCSRGTREIGSTLLGAYAPGAEAMAFPAGSGLLIEAGSVIVMEVHYGNIGPDVVDRPALALMIEDTVEKRALGAAFWDFGNWDRGGMPIPAGEKDVPYAIDLDAAPVLELLAPWFTASTAKIHIAGLHMHQLGQKGYVALRRTSGDYDCLLEVPRWDFAWQRGHTLVEPAAVNFATDRFFLECVFDNSAGAEEANWGLRTVDEMCMAFLYIVPD